jgi:hypothetical protein
VSKRVENLLTVCVFKPLVLIALTNMEPKKLNLTRLLGRNA